MSSTFYVTPQCGDIIDILMFLAHPFGPYVSFICQYHPWSAISTHFFQFFLNLYFEYQRLCWRNFGPIGDRIQWKFFNKLLHSNKHCLNLLKKIESGNMNKHFSVSFLPPFPHHVFGQQSVQMQNDFDVQRHLYLILCLVIHQLEKRPQAELVTNIEASERNLRVISKSASRSNVIFREEKLQLCFCNKLWTIVATSAKGFLRGRQHHPLGF